MVREQTFNLLFRYFLQTYDKYDRSWQLCWISILSYRWQELHAVAARIFPKVLKTTKLRTGVGMGIMTASLRRLTICHRGWVGVCSSANMAAHRSRAGAVAVEEHGPILMRWGSIRHCLHFAEFPGRCGLWLFTKCTGQANYVRLFTTQRTYKTRKLCLFATQRNRRTKVAKENENSREK